MRAIVTTSLVAASLALAAATSASADWFLDQPITVLGSVTDLDGDPIVNWGTWVDGNTLPVGGMQGYWIPLMAGFPVTLESQLIDPSNLSITFNTGLALLLPNAILTLSLPDLKAPGTELVATASAGSLSLDGSTLHWSMSTFEIPTEIKFTISQVPAPGAALLLPLAGLAGRRRRG